MTKERISSAELAQRKEEYYELLASSDKSLRDVLNQRGGLILARVGRYQPWPARFSEPGEFVKMARYRAKKGQACVYFFGSRNYGWVSKSSIQPFPEDLTALAASNKYNQHLIQEALDEAKLVMDMTDETGRRFFDRITERKDEAVDLPCERCNRVDDHYSLLILCDGKKCKREYHMNCLSPPLVAVPPGDWFCPDCEKEREKEREREREKEVFRLAKTETMDKQDSSGVGVNGVADSGTADDEQRSEEKCLLCGFGGDLIVCEFPGCTKI
uniref:PHD-type domain-containing protein n=1 Tax=Phytophthora ramorum TaxID=164328 RepID=H3HDM4_PHYRM